MAISDCKLTPRNLVRIAMGTALLTVSAFLTVPFVVPFTMQTFALFFLFTLFPFPQGFLSLVIYLLLGFLGLPVFAGFHGGFAVLFGATGGYLLGFLLAGILYFLLAGHSQNLWRQMFASLCGLVACYAFGTFFFCFIYKGTGFAGLLSALMTCVVPFILPDILKILLALLLAKRLRPIINRSQK